MEIALIKVRTKRVREGILLLFLYQTAIDNSWKSLRMALHRAMFFTLRSRAQNQFAPLFVTLRISRPKLAKRTRCTLRTFFFLCYVSCHMNESWTWVVKCKSDTSLSHSLEMFLENSEYERKKNKSCSIVICERISISRWQGQPYSWLVISPHSYSPNCE